VPGEFFTTNNLHIRKQLITKIRRKTGMPSADNLQLKKRKLQIKRVFSDRKSAGKDFRPE